jgi:hypothetical protein
VFDFALVDVTAGLGHLEPPHVANRLARARQGIGDRFLHSVWRRSNNLDFLVNVFSHARIVCRSQEENNENRLRPANLDAPVTSSEFALQTNIHSGSLTTCEHHLQSG